MRIGLCGLCGCVIGPGNYASQHWIRFHAEEKSEQDFLRYDVVEHNAEHREALEI